ncbi:dTDP-Rha--alpha-D-GlcNAc-pyrophosphate polyprenol alpha-3-L-rhamnosyltransferase [Marinifilum breve]|uniref:dTDP-Rha--alpha-D-GlcNAc-pyrophosphate polyprenol alpha-3-L-rhamnosyltransferase n=1 Tax=Marinifilum breve TaxID=2184082 RepID=A0A2V3ZXC8_9BACT|nr:MULTISPECIES: glycosyltransferase family 2 protein [Marinifilum]PXX98835.1 dTDP-Rha--alpha-D-GlcNAc-pyrophosphate polyprenol alpha-3-L-rhamnosyltransferase [Marinifilum breve]
MSTIMKEYPKVSIITVNYNQAQVTCDFLQSLKEVTYPNYEVIVVDNASPTEDPAPIVNNYPEIIFIKSEKNLGFAGGNNLGVRKSTGEYLLFINNDTEVEPDFLEPMIEKFQEDENIGMMSPKIRFHHTPDTIQYAGYTPMNPFTMRQHLIGFRKVDNGQFDDPGFTYSIHGAAMMVPRKVIEEVGMMTEVFFLYYEEHDWCARVKKAGYKVYYQPKSLVFHKESISTGKESPLKIYYISRNRIVYARRNSKGWILLFNLIYLTLITVPKNTLKYLLATRFDLLRSFYKAMFWNVYHYKGIHDNPAL